MRVLVAIPHFFDPKGKGSHGSRSPDSRPRVAALQAAVAGLHQSFGPRQFLYDLLERRAVAANAAQGNRVDVVVCTTARKHVLDKVRLPAGAYRRHPTDADPRHLGFACQAVLREGIGDYDCFGYLEDDLRIHDPWFLDKILWFAGRAGDDVVLQPNRYERDLAAGGRKAYIDGRLDPRLTAQFQNVNKRPVLQEKVLGRKVTFARAANPHAGCYFLNATQMERLASQPYFGVPDESFVGPLESAATLGVMRTFRVYKPAAEDASFLEVEHACPGFMHMMETPSEDALPPVPLGKLIDTATARLRG